MIDFECLSVISLTEVLGMAESWISVLLVGQKFWELHQDLSLTDWNAEDEELWQQMETLSLKWCEMGFKESASSPGYVYLS